MTDRAAPAAPQVSGPDELLARINKTIRAGSHTWIDVCDLLRDCRTRIAANAALAARCGELERDAARYRRARQSPAWYDDFGRKLWGNDLDAAIDAALASQAEGEKPDGSDWSAV